MTEQEALKAAEELLQIFEQISRECFEREQDTISTVEFDF